MNFVTSRGSWVVGRTLGLVALVLSACPPIRLSAQSEATVARLAPILAAEDARDLQVELLSGALIDPDPLVRRTTIRALGRIGDLRAVPLLLPLLALPDTFDLRAETAFALGLLRDTAAVTPLIEWLRGPIPLGPTAIDEGILALARIGGPQAAAFIAQVIRDPGSARADSTHEVQGAAIREAWRLGKLAPVPLLIAVARDSVNGAAAIYGLARLHPKEAASTFLDATRSKLPWVRQDAIRSLTLTYARDAGIAPTTFTAALRQALVDENIGVRINAIRALGTFGDPAFASDVATLLQDPMVDVQVTAAAALGQLGGTVAVTALRTLLDAQRPWALRREALLALSRADPAAFRVVAATWSAGADWRDRAAVAEGMVRIAPAELTPFLNDPDQRVVAFTLQAWSGAVTGADSALIAAGRARLGGPDVIVRSASADIVARTASGQDVAALSTAWQRSVRDSINDAAQSALGALLAIARGPDSLTTRAFVATAAPPADPLLKEWAEANWPELAARWGPSRPIATGRTLEDYRAIARKYLVGNGTESRPHVTVEIVDRGSVEIELLGPDAPLTVANFLRLVDRGYFDALRFHRVVPNFVIQAGDPRGDGNGGPGWAIRDEINRQRYGSGTVGMALSGPDTGGSQWFITLAPQPHLDGNYTVFGRVAAGEGVTLKVVQGDLIRRIHR